MEVLNRNQRAAALWRLSGLYATTVVIMGVIVFQSWKSYQSRADKAAIDIAVKKAVEQEKKNCMDAFKQITTSVSQEVKPAPPSSSNNSSSVQGNLNSVNNNLIQAKATQTTVKSIGAMATDLNPLKK
jgi:hypothetical protein